MARVARDGGDQADGEVAKSSNDAVEKEGEWRAGEARAEGR